MLKEAQDHAVQPDVIVQSAAVFTDCAECTSIGIIDFRMSLVDAPRKPRCLIIVPAYNERTAVGKLIRRIHKHLPDFDVLLIDDGSTDDTARQASEHTKVVSLPFNLGIGGAMQTGYRYADFHGYDIAIQVDGDGQHRPSEVARLVEKLTDTDCDLVIGSRFMSDIKYRQSFTRMTGIQILSALIKWLKGPSTTDCTSGFRAANRRVIRAFAHWYPDDYPEPEVVLLLHKAGYKVGEVPVRMRQRRSGMTSIPLTRGLFYVIKVTVCLLLDTVREPWPQGKVGDHASSVPQPAADPVRWDAPAPDHQKTQPVQT